MVVGGIWLLSVALLLFFAQWLYLHDSIRGILIVPPWRSGCLFVGLSVALLSGPKIQNPFDSLLHYRHFLLKKKNLI